MLNSQLRNIYSQFRSHLSMGLLIPKILYQEVLYEKIL